MSCEYEKKARKQTGKTYVLQNRGFQDVVRLQDDGVEAGIRRKVLPQPLGVLNKVRILWDPQLERVALLLEGY